MFCNNILGFAYYYCIDGMLLYGILFDGVQLGHRSGIFFLEMK